MLIAYPRGKIIVWVHIKSKIPCLMWLLIVEWNVRDNRVVSY
jgi:hypothetical protein